MELMDFNLTLNGRTGFKDLYFLGDIHLGSANCDEEKLAEDIDEIAKNKDAKWIGMGDYCLPLSAKILTKDGFKHYNELRIGEMVLAYNGHETIWTPLLGIYLTPSVNMLHLKSKSFDIHCSPNHKWFIRDCHTDRPQSQDVGVAKTSALKSHHKLIVAAPCTESGELDISAEEAALLGWVVTDGCIRTGDTFGASIGQAKESHKKSIRERFRYWFTAEYQRVAGDDRYLPMSIFNIKVKKWKELLSKLGVDADTLKTSLPCIVTRLQPQARKAMLLSMLMAEGWQERQLWRFSQKPSSVLEAFKILATLEGIRLGLGKSNQNSVRQIPLMESRPFVTVNDLQIQSSESKSAAWCPMTAEKSWVAQYDNQITITGNCEFITASDIRFEGKSLADWIKVKDLDDLPGTQARDFAKRVKPIKDKCLGLLRGNHENTISKRYHQDIHNYICVLLNAKNMGYVSFCRIRLFCPKEKTARKVITIFAEHGAGGGRLLGGKVTNLNRKREDIWANVYVRGHVHEKMDFDRVAVSLPSHGQLRLLQQPQLLIISGSYLRTLAKPGASSYTECASFPLVPLGCKAIRINLTRRKNGNGTDGRTEEVDIWRLK